MTPVRTSSRKTDQNASASAGPRGDSPRRRTDAAGVVGDLRMRPVVSVSVDESLWDAWQLIFVSGLRDLVVLDGDGLHGLISDRQILTDVPLVPEDLRRLKVADVAIRQACTITPQTPIAEAARELHHMQSEAVAVTDARGRIIGVLTCGDLVAWVACH